MNSGHIHYWVIEQTTGGNVWRCVTCGLVVRELPYG